MRAGHPRLVGALTLAAIAAYVAVLAYAGAGTEGYRHTQQLISELGQVGAPHAGLVRAMLVAVGAVVLALSRALHRSVAGGSSLGPWLVAGVGLALVLGGVFQCDPACAPVTFSGWTHVVTGSAASLGALVAPFVLARRMDGDPAWRARSRSSRAFGWLSLAAFAFAFASGPACGIPGVGQRVATAAQLAWVAWLAGALISAGREARP